MRDRKPAALEKVTAELRDEVISVFFCSIFSSSSGRHCASMPTKRAFRSSVTSRFTFPPTRPMWTHPKLFKLKPDRSPKLVAGVPPDYYSATGQLWGNPCTTGQRTRRKNYAWWIWRMKSNMALFDVVRLDHFRGFAAYWEVGADEETAINGKWRKGSRHGAV